MLWRVGRPNLFGGRELFAVGLTGSGARFLVAWRDGAGRFTAGFRSMAGTRGWRPSPAGEVPDAQCRPVRCARHDPARLHPYPPILRSPGLTLALKDLPTAVRTLGSSISTPRDLAAVHCHSHRVHA